MSEKRERERVAAILTWWDQAAKFGVPSIKRDAFGAFVVRIEMQDAGGGGFAHVRAIKLDMVHAMEEALVRATYMAEAWRGASVELAGPPS